MKSEACGSYIGGCPFCKSEILNKKVADDGKHKKSKSKGKRMKGGSLASDAVVTLVTCSTFDQMSAMANDVVSSYKGGSCADSGSVSAMDSYVLGAASVPGTAPAAGAGISYAGVQASVLSTLAAEAPSMISSYQNVVYPDVFVNKNIQVATMTGGSAECGMCGTI